METSHNDRINIQNLGRTCRANGAEIATHQWSLRELNQAFPEERKKPYSERKSEYVSQRREIEEKLNGLLGNQRMLRSSIRNIV